MSDKAKKLFDGIRAGDRSILAQAITLVESSLAEDQEQAAKLVDLCLPHIGHSLRIGITGVPGVGKSTFIEKTGLTIIEQGKKLAVLAIDPTSQLSKGSILGDKTRMGELSRSESAYIRPTPSRNTLGGVAGRTREASWLCEAFGFDVIFIETVGVGQSEIAVHGLVDFFLLLMLPGSGDELQGLKRGIMEMADMLVINKADGSNLDKAQQAERDFRAALHLFPPKANGEKVEVLSASAMEGRNIEEVWTRIADLLKNRKSSGTFYQHRKEQMRQSFHENWQHLLAHQFKANEAVNSAMPGMIAQVDEGAISPLSAALELLNIFQKGNS